MSAPAYVIGFLFAPRYERVVLIEKRKPAWQAGRLNGVGGKIEPGETPEQAIARECAEECGVGLGREDWTEFAREEGPGLPELHFLKAVSALACTARTRDTEKIILAEPLYLPNNVLPNVRWLVPLAMDAGFVPPIAIRGSGAYSRGGLRPGDPICPRDGSPA